MQEIISQTQAILTTTPSRWQALAASTPAELFNRRPTPGEWSALECLNHLTQVEHVFYGRVQAFLAGQNFPAYNPETEERTVDPGEPASNLATEFALARQHSLILLATLKPADLDCQVRHQELGMVTLRQMLNEWAGHDLNHTIQGERALMQVFIDGCGPWDIYFQEHRIPPAA